MKIKSKCNRFLLIYKIRPQTIYHMCQKCNERDYAPNISEYFKIFFSINFGYLEHCSQRRPRNLRRTSAGRCNSKKVICFCYWSLLLSFYFVTFFRNTCLDRNSKKFISRIFGIFVRKLSGEMCWGKLSDRHFHSDRSDSKEQTLPR